MYLKLTIFKFFSLERDGGMEINLLELSTRVSNFIICPSSGGIAPA